MRVAISRLLYKYGCLGDQPVAFANVEMDDLRVLSSEWRAFVAKSDWTALEAKIFGIADELASQFQFHDLSTSHRQELSELLAECGSSDSNAIHTSALRLTRTLARDKSGLDALMSSAVVDWVIRSSGLTDLEPSPSFAVIEEADKCLINVLHHSASSRSAFEAQALDRLCERIQYLTNFTCNDVMEGREEKFQSLADTPSDNLKQLFFFDLRILFVVSAHSRGAQERLRNAQNPLETLVSIVEHVAKNSDEKCQNAEMSLRCIFNLLAHAPKTGEAVNEPCVRAVSAILRANHVSSECSHDAVHLLTVLPIRSDDLCPSLKDAPSTIATATFEGRDMTIPAALLRLLSEKLAETPQNKDALYAPLLLVLSDLCSECREARRWCREQVLPPLRAVDVTHRPEEGSSLRAQLVRLMSSPSGAREQAAHFFFVLCKRSVSRFIKYTGFGHAAGLLANYGLLGQMNSGRRPSDSEDSETDDYRDVAHLVNPVTGAVEESKSNPLAGMSDEQKEYEATRLMQTIHDMMEKGVIRPARVAPDGRLQEMDHVLQMADAVKATNNNDDEGNSTDSDD